MAAAADLHVASPLDIPCEYYWAVSECRLCDTRSLWAHIPMLLEASGRERLCQGGTAGG